MIKIKLSQLFLFTLLVALTVFIAQRVYFGKGNRRPAIYCLASPKWAGDSIRVEKLITKDGSLIVFELGSGGAFEKKEELIFDYFIEGPIVAVEEPELDRFRIMSGSTKIAELEYLDGDLAVAWQKSGPNKGGSR